MAVTFLVRAKDGNHFAGAPVSVVPAGTDCGKKVTLPNWVKITVDDADMDSVKHIVREDENMRRRFRFTKGIIKRAIDNNGEIAIKKSQLYRSCKDISGDD